MGKIADYIFDNQSALILKYEELLNAEGITKQQAIEEIANKILEKNKSWKRYRKQVVTALEEIVSPLSKEAVWTPVTVAATVHTKKKPIARVKGKSKLDDTHTHLTYQVKIQ